MEWESVKNALNLATSDFRALLSTGEILILEPKDVIILIEHAEKSQQQLTEKDTTIASLQVELQKANECAAHWTCLYHAEETRFQRQGEELGNQRKALEEAVCLYETADMESDFVDVLEWMYQKCKGALGEGD